MPFGCFISLRSLSYFSLPFFRSRQPVMSCYATSFITLHFLPVTTGQRFASFISVAYQSTGCHNFCSPACRFGLRQDFIYLPHFRVALFKVLPCVVHFACAILKRYRFSLFGTSSISTKVASALISPSLPCACRRVPFRAFCSHP